MTWTARQCGQECSSTRRRKNQADMSALLDVPVRGHRHAEATEVDAGERRRVPAVTKIRADRESRRGGKGQLTAAEGLHAQAILRHGRLAQRRSIVQRLVLETG